MVIEKVRDGYQNDQEVALKVSVSIFVGRCLNKYNYLLVLRRGTDWNMQVAKNLLVANYEILLVRP